MKPQRLGIRLFLYPVRFHHDERATISLLESITLADARTRRDCQVTIIHLFKNRPCCGAKTRPLAPCLCTEHFILGLRCKPGVRSEAKRVGSTHPCSWQTMGVFTKNSRVEFARQPLTAGIGQSSGAHSDLPLMRA